MHICISKLTSTGILLTEPLGTNFSEILIEIYTFSFKKIHLKMSSGKWQPFCLGLYMIILGICCEILWGFFRIDFLLRSHSDVNRLNLVCVFLHIQKIHWITILCFVWCIHIEILQVIETLAYEKQGLIYPTLSVPWLLMAWQCKAHGHIQFSCNIHLLHQATAPQGLIYATFGWIIYQPLCDKQCYLVVTAMGFQVIWGGHGSSPGQFRVSHRVLDHNKALDELL